MTGIKIHLELSKLPQKIESLKLARIARLVVPDVPHHITQRGNRRGPVFFEDGDHLRYLTFLKEGADKSGTRIWAYCLMPNHVHIIAVPSHADGLRALFSESHRRYTNYVNWRQAWSGHLWQGRFGSVPMDETHLEQAIRYILQNPVRAGLVKSAEDWPHSSIKTHLFGAPDPLVEPTALYERFGDFRELLERSDNSSWDKLRQSETSGRPLGSNEWIANLADKTGRKLAPDKRGPKFRGQFT